MPMLLPRAQRQRYACVLCLPTDIHSLMQKHTPRSVCTPPPPTPPPLCPHSRNGKMHLKQDIPLSLY